jgi:hypothetical protein
MLRRSSPVSRIDRFSLSMTKAENAKAKSTRGKLDLEHKPRVRFILVLRFAAFITKRHPRKVVLSRMCVVPFYVKKYRLIEKIRLAIAQSASY